MQWALVVALLLLAGCTTADTGSQETVERFCGKGHSHSGSGGRDVVPPANAPPVPAFDEISWEVSTAGLENRLEAVLSWTATQGNLYAVLTTPDGEERFDQSVDLERAVITNGTYVLALRSDDGAFDVAYHYLLAMSSKIPDGVEGCDVDSYRRGLAKA